MTVYTPRKKKQKFDTICNSYQIYTQAAPIAMYSPPKRPPPLQQYPPVNVPINIKS